MAGKAPGRNTVGGAGPAGGRRAPTPAAPRLVLVADDGARILLDGPSVLVGRAPDNDLVLAEPSVSARHARVDVEPEGTYVTDLGSTNGTFVGGRRITGTVPLEAGVTLQLGRCALQVRAAGHRPVADTHTADTDIDIADADTRIADIADIADGGVAAEAGRRTPVIPAKRPLKLLASFDPADAEWGEQIVERLERIGHDVAVDRSPAGDGWAGRLLDLMWTRDAVLFVVSATAAASERIHREVHLAGAEHTTVIPVLVDDADLPDDLAYYVQRRRPVDLRRDPAAGLSELQARLDTVTPKRVARPWQLARRVALALLVLVLLFVAYRFVTG